MQCGLPPPSDNRKATPVPDVGSYIACVIIGYAFGCVLTADIVCRVANGTSAFSIGRGNPGMANIAHEMGVRWGLVVLAGDIAKTVIPMAACWMLFPDLGSAAALWSGLGVTIGHNYPVWHRFKGGKGVTTTCATIIVSSPVLGIPSTLVGLAVVLGSKRLCLGAIAITIAYLVACTLFVRENLIPALLLLAMMVAAHASAVRGIKTGETPETDLLSKLKRK